MKILLVVFVLAISIVTADYTSWSDDKLEGKIVNCSLKEQRHADKHFKVLNKLYNKITPYFVAYNITNGLAPFPDDILSPNVDGQIVDYIYDMNYTLVTEYFTALTGVVMQWNPLFMDGISRPGNYYNFGANITRFLNNGTISYYVATFNYYRVIGNINIPGNWTIDPDSLVNIDQHGLARFDCNNLIINFLMDISYLHQFFIFLQRYPYTPGLINAFETSICGAHQTYCAGTPYQQFDNESQCLTDMMAIPPGEPAIRGVQNSTICRTIHVLLVAVNPAIHCQHLALNSMPCRDWTYEQFFDEHYYLFITPLTQDPQSCNANWVDCQDYMRELIKRRNDDE